MKLLQVFVKIYMYENTGKTPLNIVEIRLHKRKKTENKEMLATIEAIPMEETEEVNIVVDHTIEITKVIYKWNSNKERTIQGDGSNHLEIQGTWDVTRRYQELKEKILAIH